MLLEVCVDSVESAIAAQNGGADRLELCANLMIGGTTPSIALLQEIRKQVNLPIHILIRPRFGDFLYTDLEYSVMCQEIKMFREAGAQGMVIGMLDQKGNLDVDRMKGLLEVGGGMSVTLHRAFDMTSSLFESLKTVKHLGIQTILTSGGKDTATKGIDTLRELILEAEGTVEIMAGAGVNAEQIPELFKAGVRTFHMSGKKVIESAMLYRNESVNMGIQCYSEYSIWRTDPELIRQARNLLDHLVVI